MGIAAAAAIPELVIPEVAAVSALPEIAAAAIPAALSAVPDIALETSVIAPAVTAADVAGPLAASALPAASALAPTAATTLASILNPISTAEAATVPTAMPSIEAAAAHPGATAAGEISPLQGPTTTMGPSSISPTPGPAAAAPAAPSSVPVSPASTGQLDLADQITQETGLPTATDSAASTATTPTATPSSSLSSIESAAGKTAAADIAPGSSSNLLSSAGNLASKAGNYLEKHPEMLLAGGGALANFLMQPKFPSVGSSLKPLENQASALQAQGSQLQSYLQSGTLPPGVQAGLDSAAEAAKAAIRSKYAAMGGGAETSSAAVNDIANVDVVKQTQGANIALQLLQQGVSETQLSSQLYTELLNATLSNDSALSNSIGNFASSLVQPRVTINTGATTTSTAT